ncbi:MAG: GNAT family N-acetyltransferase [Hellea sp.]|nr:GNAT family N-acetyltransferase [Hellea sp.]
MVLGRKSQRILTEQAPGGRVELIHPRWADFDDWVSLRRRNKNFLSPWEPDWSDAHLTRNSFKARLGSYNRMLDQGTGYPFHVFAGPERRLIGACNLNRIIKEPAQSAQLGYWIGEEFARQGFARAAVRAALKFSFEDQGLHRVEAAVQPNNERSVKLLKITGFKKEGTARGFLKIGGHWKDHDIYSRLSSD